MIIFFDQFTCMLGLASHDVNLGNKKRKRWLIHFSSLVSFYTHFWTMIFDLKRVNIKDCAKYVVSLDQLHSFMCFAIIKSAVFAICPFTRFSLTMHNCSLKIEIESQKSKLYLSNHGRPYFYICKSNMLRGKNIVG